MPNPFYPRQRDYIEVLNAMAAQLGALAGGGFLPRLARFTVAAPQSRFALPSAPLGGVALLSLNGLWQHEAAVEGTEVVIDPPAEAGDDILVVYWE